MKGMEWIAVAIVFCFLMWRWPKRTIICILSSIGIIIIIWLCVIIVEYINNREKPATASFEVKVEYQIIPMLHKNKCSGDYPLNIEIKNNTIRSVDETYFRILAKHEGRSSIIYKKEYMTDRIIDPGETLQMCFPIQSTDKEVYEPDVYFYGEVFSVTYSK